MTNKILLSFFTFLLIQSQVQAQCTPVDCSASLPDYGGLCSQDLAQGVVNMSYSDSESFILTDNCFDAGLFDPNLSGTNIKITNVDNFSFVGFPSGITGTPNQTSYSPPTGGYIAGCAAFTGTPTEAGVFEANIDFVADVELCPLGIPLADNDVGFPVEIIILPDPSFTGLNTDYFITDPVATMTITGTMGGTFSGPGVSGNTFDPSIAGVGTHTITYTVSAQEGTAIASATNSMDMIVNVTAVTDADMDGYDSSVDCDDDNPNVNPGATEICNGKDENCDGVIDEGFPADFTYYLDNDMDGYGDTDSLINTCQNSAPFGYVVNGGDCDDDNPDVNPSVPEICNGIDDNCSGNIDDTGFDPFPWYTDADNDGFTDNDNVIFSPCSPGAGYSNASSPLSDCDDTNPNINPDAPEICDGIDNNCDGNIDEGFTEFTYYADADNDGFGDAANELTTCEDSAPDGYADNANDCDDTNPNINPSADEACDGIDNNCNSNIDEGLTEYTYYADMDEDGFGDAANETITCEDSAPAGYVDNANDCDDTNPDINPSASEVCDGIDNNCDSNVDEGLAEYTYYADTDEDGFGDAENETTTCEDSAPDGYVGNADDCDDSNPDINPNGTEIPNNNIDEDCNGSDLMVSTNDLESQLGIKAFPNPASQNLFLQSEISEVVSIEIYNSVGKRVRYENINLHENSIIDISTIQNGVYILKITNEEQKTGSYKFIVIH